MPQVVDLFCGVGGLTRGLLNAGLNVIAGFDIDPTCQYTYEHNNNVDYINENVRNLTGADIEELYDEGELKILVGCAPCQPFSQMRFKLGEANAKDEKYNLLLEYGRLINEVHPAIVSMENVPQIQDTNIFAEFLNILQENGYQFDYHVIYCPDYGIPQTRRRFVLVGSLLGPIEIIGPTHNRNDIHVKDFIQNLPPIGAGEVDPNDALHRAAALSERNLDRIRHSKPGGTWRDWPEELRCECHKKTTGQTYSSVYGRMTWEQIGPTITTQFYNYGTGRYGHPVQDRALSLREGALLQTFPDWYDFIDPERNFVFNDIARHIGNAVPVRLGEVIGETILTHLEEHGIEV
ncbi:DNA cytosine methyltransferase [uncultured Ruminococcus sp.]|mgnify:CR=1 FL=1|uniref:DNA cytosine methyltransferase n=1 Tax=uncultured Ruminococcus sp. TaxID=165186 RepID=UPI002665D66C|nr:DNA cytosine methyltransferase [uncultured Ruminococcus sp.]